MSQQKAVVSQFIVTKLLPKGLKISEGDLLFSNGTIDSLGVLELIAFLEKTFKVRIDTQKHELREFDSVNLIDTLLGKLSRGV